MWFSPWGWPSSRLHRDTNVMISITTMKNWFTKSKKKKGSSHSPNITQVICWSCLKECYKFHLKKRLSYNGVIHLAGEYHRKEQAAVTTSKEDSRFLDKVTQKKTFWFMFYYLITRNGLCPPKSTTPQPELTQDLSQAAPSIAKTVPRETWGSRTCWPIWKFFSGCISGEASLKTTMQIASTFWY